jgi:hypothetical protein
LFEVEDFDRNQILLDACCGFGRIAASAKAAGYTNVIAADIVDRGYPGCEIQDFLQRQSVPPTVVCNPPFNMVEAFARHALTLGACRLALIFPVARLNAARIATSFFPKPTSLSFYKWLNYATSYERRNGLRAR